MANGNGIWSDMPWWVKAIALVGVPSLISIGVIASDRVQLTGKVDAQAQAIQRLESGATLHDSRVWQQFEELGDAAKETNRILLAGCVNEATKAKNPIEARERCIGR